MKKLLCFFILLPALASAQIIKKSVNKFDGTISYSYSASVRKMMTIPISFYKEIKGGDTILQALIMQDISRDEFMNNHDGKMISLEFLKDDGVHAVNLDSISYAVAKFESNPLSYTAYGVVSIDEYSIVFFKGINGVRINGIGEGAMMSKRDRDDYNNILASFISDNPQIQ